MTATRLLQTVCSVAMLAAGPAFAQSNTPTGDTGAGGAPNNPTAHETMPTSAPSATEHGGSVAPTKGSHGMHRMAMAHTSHAAHSRSDTSQDAAVDRLNDQSYEAARAGRTDDTSGTVSPTDGSTGTK